MTRYEIIDNSGALEAKLIKVLSNRPGVIGDMLIVSLVKVLPHKKVTKGEIHRALLVRSQRPWVRPDGSSLRWSHNGIILLTSDLAPLATRILGPVPLELQRFKKIAVLATQFI